jgi:hypothetical protein
MTFDDIMYLTENKKQYQQMMQPILDVYLKLERKVDAERLQDRIKFIRTTFVRNDRIIWMLKWVRLDELMKLQKVLNSLGDNPELLKFVNRSYEKTSSNMGHGDVLNNTNQVINAIPVEFPHYMSYTNPNSANYIKALDAVVWDNQSYDNLIYQLSDAETTWQKKQDSQMQHPDTHYNNARILIKFKDGFEWWNLGVESCDKEASAMGHCGNTATPKNGDQILSLRETKTINDKTTHYPHLTFILGNDGRLGEMKGKANQKPNEKYHKYIIPLLKNRVVRGFGDGGHDSENNFSMNDLPEQTKNKLIDSKPILGGSDYFYAKEGYTERTMDLLVDELNDTGFPELYGWSSEFNGQQDEKITLARWDDLEKFGYDVDFTPLSDLVKYMEAVEDEDVDDLDDTIDEYNLTEDDVISIFDYLSDEYIQRIADSLNISGNARSPRVRALIALNIHDSKYEKTLRESLINSATISSSDEKNIIEYTHILLDVVNRYMDLSEGKLIRHDDGSITLEILIGTLIDVVSNHSEEYSIESIKSTKNWAVGHEGEAAYNWKNINNHGRYSNDELKFITKMVKMINSDELIERMTMDYPAAADWFRKHIDWNESVEINANMIMELKRLAGIT